MSWVCSRARSDVVTTNLLFSVSRRVHEASHEVKRRILRQYQKRPFGKTRSITMVMYAWGDKKIITLEGKACKGNKILDRVPFRSWAEKRADVERGGHQQQSHLILLVPRSFPLSHIFPPKYPGGRIVLCEVGDVVGG